MWKISLSVGIMKSNQNLYLFIVSIWSFLYAEQGFFKDNWVPKAAPVYSFHKAHPLSTAEPGLAIRIDFSDTICKVLPTVFGHNINPWVKGTIHQNEKALKHLKRLSVSDLRLPGGNWTSVWMWDGTLPQNVRDGYEELLKGPPNQSWTMTTDNIIALADALNARPQPCVNYALARFFLGDDRVQRAASYAAAWVRDLNIKKQKGAKYWEVGNEHYGSWQAGYEVSGLGVISGTEYGRDFRAFADSMRAADPSIKIGAVLLANEKEYGNWSAQVLPEVQNHADFLVIHEYFTWASDINTITVQQMLDSIVLIKKSMDNLKSMVEKYTNKNREHFPVALTEYNVRAGRKNSSMVSNLFVNMVLGEVITHGYGLVNIWDISNGYDETEGDHGLLSRNNPDLTDNTPHPSFFAYYYFGSFFGDVMLRTHNEQPSLYVYASRFSTGEGGMVIVNPTVEEKTVSIELGDFSPGDSVYWFTVSADDPESNNIEINGNRGPEYGFGPENYHDIAPYSSALTSPLIFTVKPWSSNYLLLENRGDVKVERSREKKAECGLQFWHLGRNIGIKAPEVPDKVDIYGLNGQRFSVKFIWDKTRSAGMVLLPKKSGLYILKVKTGKSVYQKHLIFF